MKTVRKFKLTKKQKLLAILSALLLVIGTACAIAVPLIGGNTDPTKKDPPEILEGEALYLNTTIAYPMVSEANIQYILVQNANGSFDMLRDGNIFYFSFDDGDGVKNMRPYLPPIVDAEGGFDYSSLYAIEQNDGYGQIYMLSYLCTAIGTPYFSERIPLPESGSERELLLKEYGFVKEKSETVTFVYTEKDSEGKTVEKSHTVKIGGKAVSGAGYYFMVDGRNYVYYTSNSYFDYALKGFHSFIKGTLVAEGLREDSAFEPYLTTDFRHWANEEHKKENEAVTAGSNVIVDAEIITPLNKGADYVPSTSLEEKGYAAPAFDKLGFDLEALKEHPDFQRISSILTSMKVGKQENQKLITMLYEDGTADSKLIDFSGKTNYTYTISKIESVITDTDEIETEGYAVGGSNLIKVAYFYSIDGVSQTSLLRHAVLDLSLTAIPTDAVNALRAASVGTLTTPVTFDLTYTKDNAIAVNESLVIANISRIFNKDGSTAEAVGEDSYVTFDVYKVINGKKTDAKTRNIQMSDLSGIQNGEDIKRAILGKSVGTGLNIKAYESTTYYEIFRDFEAYRIREVDYFITSNLVAHFRFLNASDRDPYYGESFYENMLDTEYRFYGLNADACESIVEYLGGIPAGNGVTSVGFAGETVATGLTHANMEKYGLYAYKVYFELPRGISDITEGTEYDEENMLSDYSWLGKLGFTLYIGEKRYDSPTGEPYRYVGSDMYDVIARVYGEELDFVERSFTDLYARDNIMFASISDVDLIEVDFKMSDLYGKYNFAIEHKDLYLGYENGKPVAKEQYFEGATVAEKLLVYVSAQGERIDTAFEPMYQNALQNVNPELHKVSISYIYNVVNNGGEPMHESLVDTVGVANFKQAYQLLLLTRYQGILTPEEKAEAKSGTPDMTIRVKMTHKAYYYTYDFYRFDDRRVMVSVYQTDTAGNRVSPQVSDFYISTFAFKKLCANYVNLLNGVYVNRDQGYNDIPIGE